MCSSFLLLLFLGQLLSRLQNRVFIFIIILLNRVLYLLILRKKLPPLLFFPSTICPSIRGGLRTRTLSLPWHFRRHHWCIFFNNFIKIFSQVVIKRVFVEVNVILSDLLVSATHNKVVSEQLKYIRPFIWVSLETTIYEISELCRYILWKGRRACRLFNSQKHGNILFITPRRLSHVYFIDSAAKTPDISKSVMSTLSDNLWSHPVRSSSQWFIHWTANLLRASEIC